MEDQTTVTTTNGGDGTGANPVIPAKAGDQNNSTTQVTPFDPSKVSDEEFEKVFSDERLFKHSRFKDLSDKAQKAKEYEAAEAKRQEEELKKKGEWETISKQNETKVQELQTQLTKERVDNALLAASSKLGVVDPDAVLKLIDRGAISIDDTGAVQGIETALTALIEAKPYLAGKQPAKRIGGETNPGNTNTGELKRFKLSELNNPEFYRANEKDILASLAANLIEDDVN